MAMAVSSPEPANISYQRQASSDSGWDNPFRPDGNLSREADEIVELIKGGKPITPTSAATPVTAAALPATADASVLDGALHVVAASPKHEKVPLGLVPDTEKGTISLQSCAKLGANGKATATGGSAVSGSSTGASVAATSTPLGSVEVQRVTVDASQAVEHVVLKKKQKCKCCVIQ